MVSEAVCCMSESTDDAGGAVGDGIRLQPKIYDARLPYISKSNFKCRSLRYRGVEFVDRRQVQTPDCLQSPVPTML